MPIPLRRVRGGALRRLVHCAVLAGTALAVAPAVAVAVAAGTPPPEAVAVPIPEGRVAAAVSQLDGLVTEAMERTGVPGVAVAVVHRDRIVYAKGFGVRSVRSGAPVDADTVFQIASLSKPVGATVIARAVGQGTVRWSDRLRAHLPWFALRTRSATAGVRLDDLYAHRSGLPDHAGDLLEDLGFARRTILRRLRFLPLTPLRTAYAYTNFGLTAAAEAVARASGTSWEALSQRQLYGPLGMRATSSRYADYRSAANRADLHVRRGDRWEQRHNRQPDAQSPAGGVSSSARDLARWMRMMLAGGRFEGRQLIAPAALAPMWTPHALTGAPGTPASRVGFYGLGLGVGTDWTGRVRLSHSGAFALGAATNLVLLPSEELGIVVLTNGEPVGLPEALTATFADLVEAGRPERDWLPAYEGLYAAMSENRSRLADRRRPAGTRPPRPARAYLGAYRNRYFGRLRVVRRDGRLTMLLGPRQKAFRLRHWRGDTFSYLPAGENATGIAAVDFRVRGGRVRAVRVENLDGEGLGTFARAQAR